jgi:23S rRNA pseudouridine2605 synthase
MQSALLPRYGRVASWLEKMSAHVYDELGWVSMERLQKILSSCGVGSRRYCDALIRDGRVSVDGVVVSVLGSKADASTSVIAVDGKPIRQRVQTVTIALHKPKGVITSTHDPQGRPTVMDYVALSERVFPIGRLDYDSEGLLLLTNDGALAHALTHPKYHVPKTYWVYTDVVPHGDQLDKLRSGIDLDGVRTLPADVEYVDVDVERKQAIVRMTITEGRQRQIRRMWESVRLPVVRLKRMSIGPIELGYLRRGTHRIVRSDELAQLWASVRDRLQ